MYGARVFGDISTHAPRTGSDLEGGGKKWWDALISTHAPRTGSDHPRSLRCADRRHFNPRSPHGERRYLFNPPRREGKFQPTLPARGATRTGGGACALAPRISTHAPRTGSDIGFKSSAGHPAISTHAPRTGSDQINPATMRGSQGISTHAPRTGSDGGCNNPRLDHGDFNPRSPHGERLNATFNDTLTI